MTLLREIQAAAVDSSADLPTLLRRCKVLASRLKLAELAAWSNLELNGYPDISRVPEYRRVRVSAIGHFMGPFQSGLKNAPIPPSTLPEGLRHLAEYHTFSEGVSVLVSHVANGDPTLRAKWPADAIALLQSVEIYEGGLVLADAWGRLSRSSVQGILDTIRTRVLDFALAVEEADPQAGDRAPGEASNVTPAQGATIFNTTIINGQANIGTGGDASISVMPGTLSRTE
jgi:hypothetical protein